MEDRPPQQLADDVLRILADDVVASQDLVGELRVVPPTGDGALRVGARQEAGET
ncbi:hypothetical protein ACWDX6_20525 [Streptomyces sp. NPDC003027]